MKNSKLIIKAALIAGTLDISAACLNFYIKTQKGPATVLKYISSAVFDKSAMSSGIEMVFLGLLFHFLIAFIFTVIFSLIFDKLWLWLKNTYVIAIVYGILVWLVMNLLVVPNSAAPKIPFTWNGAIVNCFILIICIGLPLSYLFSKNKRVN